MRNADTILSIHQKRGSEGLPLERVYRHLFDPELYLRAYGKIYRNAGATTRGTTGETVDGMSLRRIHNIIDLLKQERYVWTPVRRIEIPKEKGGFRPLGIPTWSDKLVQEVLRSLLEPYYEQRYSELSHGFRPGRSCHTALKMVQRNWRGTAWFIEGDIKGCFDNIDHEVLLSIITRDIHDGRLTTLIRGLLKAGYMEGWRYNLTESGTPQGGIISPLLANIYLNELDRFVEDTLIPAYTRGDKRRRPPEYYQTGNRIAAARKRKEPEKVHRLILERRQMHSVDPMDPEFRRLRYVRYADDFLLGFAGPKNEAEEIRRQIGEYLGITLKLTLSAEKTLITHAGTDKAKFLGHEITVARCNTRISDDGGRRTNGSITLLMPQRVYLKYRKRFSKGDRITHRTNLLAESDYTIIQRYQGVLMGLYNFYCMATNVSRRIADIKWVLETSLTKTLAHKFKCRVSRIYKKYQVIAFDRKMLRVVIERPDRDPLVAIFGGFALERNPDGMGMGDFNFMQAWSFPASKRSEVVQRLLAGKCELCGVEGIPVEVHHIRKLADIDRPGRRPTQTWQKIMCARKRKTLVVCERCHDDIHAGEYDGPAL